MWAIERSDVLVSIYEFVWLIRFGRKNGPSLREVALGLVKKAAERCGMTLGDLKVLLLWLLLQASGLIIALVGTGPKVERLHLLPTLSGVAVRLRRRIL